MGESTEIAWTDATFNPWWGCTKVSPGCDHCYAETFDKRVGGAHWGKGTPRRVMSDDYWKHPLRWNKAAGKDGKRIKVFCGSMCDVMDDEAPEGQRRRLWDLINSTPNLIWQLLTKRPQRYVQELPSMFIHRNIILGATAENQRFYLSRWQSMSPLKYFRGFKTFISYEPALGPLDLTKDHIGEDCGFPDWIICGGESGGNARPMQIQWASDLRDQCARLHIPFFMKQLGGNITDFDQSKMARETGKSIHDRKGGDWNEWPEDLRVRQFPVI